MHRARRRQVEAACRASLKDLCLIIRSYLIWPSGFSIPWKRQCTKRRGWQSAVSGVSIHETWTAWKLVDHGLQGHRNVKLQLCRSRACWRLPGSPDGAAGGNPTLVQQRGAREVCVKNGLRMVGYHPSGSRTYPGGRKLPHIIDPTLKRLLRK